MLPAVLLAKLATMYKAYNGDATQQIRLAKLYYMLC